MVGVPSDAVDRHVVSLVRVKECARVRLRADVYPAFLRPDEVEVVLVGMKIHRGAAAYKILLSLKFTSKSRSADIRDLTDYKYQNEKI